MNHTLFPHDDKEGDCHIPQQWLRQNQPKAVYVLQTRTAKGSRTYVETRGIENYLL